MHLLGKKISGFSLLEVIVTMAILAVMTSILFYNYPRLSQAVAFDAASQNILDVIRSAQITGSSRGGDYRGDGVYFKLSDPTNFISFFDYANIVDPFSGTKKSDKIYSNNLTPPPASTELDQLIPKTKIQNNVRITDICVKNSSVKSCAKAEISISFTRPFLSANISDHSGSPSYNFYEKAYIELYIDASDGIDQKCILIYKYGQVDIKSGSCNLQP
jgi:prepilin-type N-terminal cleavage/methylation domain-containing protein